MRIFRYIPLLFFVVITYFVVIYFVKKSGLSMEILPLPLPSGESFSITIADLIVILGLFSLFFELLKATRTGTLTIVDHGLSTFLFTSCLVIFLAIGEAATSTFFLILLISFIDVVAGFTITIFGARRDISLDQGSSAMLPPSN